MCEDKLSYICDWVWKEVLSCSLHCQLKFCKWPRNFVQIKRYLNILRNLILNVSTRTEALSVNVKPFRFLRVYNQIVSAWCVVWGCLLMHKTLLCLRFIDNYSYSVIQVSAFKIWQSRIIAQYRRGWGGVGIFRVLEWVISPGNAPTISGFLLFFLEREHSHNC
jgi:hypothetical protein